MSITSVLFAVFLKRLLLSNPREKDVTLMNHRRQPTAKMELQGTVRCQMRLKVRHKAYYEMVVSYTNIRIHQL